MSLETWGDHFSECLVIGKEGDNLLGSHLTRNIGSDTPSVRITNYSNVISVRALATICRGHPRNPNVKPKMFLDSLSFPLTSD